MIILTIPQFALVLAFGALIVVTCTAVYAANRSVSQQTVRDATGTASTVTRVDLPAFWPVWGTFGAVGTALWLVALALYQTTAFMAFNGMLG